MSKRKKPLALVMLSVIIAACVIVCIAIFIPKGNPADPSTFSEIGVYLKKDASWYETDEAASVADAIVKYQLSDGGWRKDWANPDVEGSWAKSTIDNDGTTSEIYILARMYNETHKQRYKSACIKGIKLLLDGQYDNGGWPQVFDDPGTYHAHITYNDHAMVHVLRLLKQVSERSGDFEFVSEKLAERAKKAVDKGVQCVLDTQIVVRGVRTAWCQQHDEFTLAPAQGRAYEHPTICCAESVGIVEFLMTLDDPDCRISESINAAVEWMRASQLEGIKFVTQGDDRVVVEDPDADPIWARFYEIETNRPLFSDRDGSIHYDVSEISKERRTGYAWYGNWAKKLVK